jgi:hypothetical protein
MGTPRRSLLDNIEEAAEKPASKRKRLPPRIKPSNIDAAKEEVLGFIERNTWAMAETIHLVGLYVVAHEHVYKVPPLDMDGAAWFLAKRAADKLVEECFANNVEYAVKYLQWVWMREGEKEEWRRRNGTATYRLTWRLVFSRQLLTDYFVNQQRPSLPR